VPAEQLAASEGRREADAARNVASLAVVRGDLSKAVRYFQMALEANPEDLDAAVQLGYAWISGGELDQAGPVFAAVIQQAKAAQDPRPEGWGLNGRPDVLVAQGDGPGSFSQAMDSDVGLGLMIQPLDSGIGFMSPIELLDSVCCFSP